MWWPTCWWYAIILIYILSSIAARVYFSTSSYRVNENNGQVQIRLYLSYSLSTTVSVQILAEDYTAFVSG